MRVPSLKDGLEHRGQVAFFTEAAQSEAVRSMTVAKVLTIRRSHYNDVSDLYPIGGRTTLENLGNAAEEVHILPPSPQTRLFACKPSHPAHPSFGRKNAAPARQGCATAHSA